MCTDIKGHTQMTSSQRVVIVPLAQAVDAASWTHATMFIYARTLLMKHANYSIAKK